MPPEPKGSIIFHYTESKRNQSWGKFASLFSELKVGFRLNLFYRFLALLTMIGARCSQILLISWEVVVSPQNQTLQ